jgi:RNA polymerase sigma-70 factor (ECF subfamily)
MNDAIDHVHGSPMLTRRPLRGAEEADVVDSARRGDRASFDVLVDRYRIKVRSYLAKRLPSSEVEDVLQESLIAAWRAMPAFEGRSEFNTWILAIAHFKLQDHFRKQKNQTIDLESLSLEPSANEQAFERFDLAESVRGIIEGLAPPKGAILELYYGQRMTFDEIAKHLGKNTSTVKYHFYQAHDTVAIALKGAGQL